MHFNTSFLLASALALTTASPIKKRATGLTEAVIQAIAPDTASCAGATYPDECADASQAVGPINDSFIKYGIASLGEQQALLAIMLFESGNFKYNKHHFPGPNPGQGTRNMQSPEFNTQYATTLFGANAVAQAQTQGGLDCVLALVSGNEESFGSAAWFLSTQCSQAVRTQLATGSKDGWSAYLTQCVGTTDTSDRDQGWAAVQQNFKG